MKTGVMIEAEITDKGLNNFSVRRMFVVGEEWVRSRPELNLEDANEFIELMVEGIQSIIMNCHDKGLADSPAMHRKALAMMDKAFVQACKTSIDTTKDKKNYKGEK